MKTHQITHTDKENRASVPRVRSLPVVVYGILAFGGRADIYQGKIEDEKSTVAVKRLRDKVGAKSKSNKVCVSSGSSATVKLKFSAIGRIVAIRIDDLESSNPPKYPTNAGNC